MFREHDGYYRAAPPSPIHNANGATFPVMGQARFITFCEPGLPLSSESSRLDPPAPTSPSELSLCSVLLNVREATGKTTHGRVEERAPNVHALRSIELSRVFVLRDQLTAS